MKRVAVIFLCVAYVLSLAGCKNTHFSDVYEGKAVRVLDGDSINILQHGREIRIRLAEINASEYGQPFWKKSKQALENYVAAQQVMVEEFDRDQYGRIVGHVYVDGIWVNGELVKQGYAYVYARYAVSKKLYQYEANAEKNKLGIWRLPQAERIKPWDWRNRAKNNS